MSRCEAVRARALAMLADKPGNDLGVASDASGDPVLLAIARPNTSYVLAIDAAEHDGVELALFLGFPRLKPPPAIERASAEAQAVRRGTQSTPRPART